MKKLVILFVLALCVGLAEFGIRGQSPMEELRARAQNLSGRKAA